jgi:glycerol kinase
VARPDVVETTALGAAALAGLALGVWGSVEEFTAARRFTRFVPVMGRDERERKLAEWRRAIGAALAWARG